MTHIPPPPPPLRASCAAGPSASGRQRVRPRGRPGCYINPPDSLPLLTTSPPLTSPLATSRALLLLRSFGFAEAKHNKLPLSLSVSLLPARRTERTHGVGVDGAGGGRRGGVRGGEADGGAVVAAAAGGAALRAAGDQGPPLPLLRRLRPRDGGAHGGRLRQANAAPLPLPQRPPARPRLLPPLEENLRYANVHVSVRAYPTNESIPFPCLSTPGRVSPGSVSPVSLSLAPAASSSVRLRWWYGLTEPNRQEGREPISINMMSKARQRPQAPT